MCARKLADKPIPLHYHWRNVSTSILSQWATSAPADTADISYTR